MIQKLLLLCVLSFTFVNCTSDNDKKISSKQLAIDTPVEIISEQGSVLDVIKPLNLEYSQSKPSASVPKPKDELADVKKAWTDSDFDSDVLRGVLIGPEICSLGEKQYVGCFFAAQEMSGILEGEDTILVVEGQQNVDFIGEKIKSLGLFAVHKRPVLPVLEKKDLAGRSERAKKANEFFKETVQVVLSVYRNQIASVPLVIHSNNLFTVEFPKTAAALRKAVFENNVIAHAAAVEDINVLSPQLESAKTDLSESPYYKDYVELIVKTFEKIPAEDRAWQAGNIYNAYLRHSVDGHAGISLDPKIEEGFEAATAEAVYGIGVTIRSDAQDDGSFIHMEPLENSSAHKSGVQSNDRVVMVNGVVPTSLQNAVDMIKGPRDTEVAITVERWGTKIHETLTIKRQPLPRKSFTLALKTLNTKSYGVLTINTFVDATMAAEVRKFVKANDKSVEGWILDLRNNPGGLLTQAVELLSVFLPKGTATVVQSVEGDPNVIDPTSLLRTSQDAETTKNVVVLINENSASASEIVSGVLQEKQRALVLGERTFGKGSVQTLFQQGHIDIPDYAIWRSFPTLSFKKTTGRYFFSSGRTPEWVGVEPDLTLLENPEAIEVFSPREQDIIPFSMGNLGQTWVQPRAAYVEEVKDCVSTTGVEIKKWTPEESEKPLPINYQTLYAFDALKCM